MTTGPGFPQPDYEPPPLVEHGSVVDAGAKVKAPAICLAILGFVAFLLNAACVVVLTSGRDWLKENLSHLEGPFKQLLGAQTDQDLDVSAALTALCALFGLVTLVGSIQMFRLRSRGLAIAGACLAMLNFESCCCVAGLPLGIWAMVVLLEPEVAQAFAARRTQPGA